MHELLLFGEVPSARYNPVLKVLAGIAAMQPQVITERHLIFRPRKPLNGGSVKAPSKPGVSSSQNQSLQAQMHGDLFYLQLVGDLQQGSTHPNDSRDLTEGLLNSEANVPPGGEGDKPKPAADKADDFSMIPWTVEFRDLPEVPSRRPVTSRLMASVSVVEGDPLSFMDALGYTYASEYILTGHRLIHNNIILLLYRALPVPKSGIHNPLSRAPLLSTLSPLDPSGGAILQASIRVADGSKVEIVTLAMDELKWLKDMLKGVVEMEVGDRLALDTRVK